MLLTWILVFLYFLPVSLGDICSKNVLFTSEVVELYDQDKRQYARETSVHFNIGLKETVCFQVADKSNTRQLQTYYLSFDDVQSIFTYKNSYDFAIADPQVTCICDCPGLEDHCSPNRDNCVEDGRRDDDTCYNYYKGDEVSDGCGLFAPMGASSICCSVGFRAYEKERYTGFEISTPVTRGSFSLQTTDYSNKYTTREFAADLDKGSKIFMEGVSVSFETPGKTIPIPDGWYFGRSGSKEVLTNVKINGLNEWDINRLGWLKYNAEDKLQYLPTEVKPVFSAETVNCKENAVDVKFASDYSNRQILEAKPLEEYYASTVRSAIREDEKRDLFVTFRQFDRMKVMLTFTGEKEVIQHFSSSSFQDFEGEAILDKHSNRVLKITIIKGSGTLYGTMKVGGIPVETFDFTIDSVNSSPTDYANYVQITQWCSNSGTTELCFHTGDTDNESCKPIFCESEENSKFEIPDSAIDYLAGNRESLGDSKVWLRYTNPAEWLNGITGLQEAVCMLVVIGAAILLTVLIVLIFRKTNLWYCIVRGVYKCPCWGKTGKEHIMTYMIKIDKADHENNYSSSDDYSHRKEGKLHSLLVRLKLRRPPDPKHNSNESSYSESDQDPTNFYEDVVGVRYHDESTPSDRYTDYISSYTSSSEGCETESKH